MARSYQHLTLEDRALIQTQLSMGWRPAAIAAGLQQSRSTVTRELRRNGWQPAALVTWQSRRWGNVGYLARLAERRARQLHRAHAQLGARSPDRFQRSFLDPITIAPRRSSSALIPPSHPHQEDRSPGLLRSSPLPLGKRQHCWKISK